MKKEGRVYAKSDYNNSKEISLLKPITSADYKSKTILTDSAWEYVELWFKRQKDEKSKNALFYWQQAKHFFLASEKLPQNSKPLTSYYCCLNATKALLCVNGINVTNISHGITQARHEQVQSNSLDKAEVIFLGSGVLNELSRYLGENVDKQTHNIKDLLYNIPCVHRSFAITYTGTTELFVPIRNLKFIREDTTSKAWVQFDLDARYANASTIPFDWLQLAGRSTRGLHKKPHNLQLSFQPFRIGIAEQSKTVVR